MKESLKDILHSDFVAKTKSTLQDLVSGVKNLFRHNTDEAGNNLPVNTNLNNHLKSPDEIEAEFRLLAASQTEETGSVKTEETKDEMAIMKSSETHFKTSILNEPLPEYMEENY